MSEEQDVKVTFILPTAQDSSESLQISREPASSMLESIYWQALGWVHTPSFKGIDLLKEPCLSLLSESKLTSDSSRLQSDKSFRPKVQIENQVPYGVLPKEIAEEIYKRRFAKQDLNIILHDIGLEPNIIRPPLLYYQDTFCFLKTNYDEGIQTEPFLPLHSFDDEWFYESRSPEEWLSLGHSQGEKRPIPATALIPIKSVQQNEQFEWQKVAVLDYCKERKLFRVREETNCEKHGNILRNKDEVLDLWVHRIYLKFEAEDSLKFVRRLYNAVTSRYLVEESLRLNYYVDCMPQEKLAGWPQKDVDGIFSFALRNLSLHPSIGVENCKIQLDYEYKRVTNLIIYNRVTGQDPDLLKEFKSEQLQGIYVPHASGHLVNLKYSFAKRRESFEYSTLWSQEEVVRVLQLVQIEILNLYNKSLYLVTTDVLAIERYETLQRTELTKLEEYIRGPWIANIVHAVESNLSKCGTGSYDLNQTYVHTFQLTKLGKLLKMITFKMEDVIRFLVYNSLRMYSERIIEACKSLANIKEGFRWSDGFFSMKFSPSCPPVFEVALEVKEQHLEYIVQLKKYLDVAVSLFEEGLNVTKDLEKIQKLVMKKLSCDPLDRLNTVKSTEEKISLWRKLIISGLSKAITVATAYAQSYDNTLKAFKEDHINYVKRLSRSEVTCEKLKQIIEMHHKEKIELAYTIPTYIEIGPFRLLTGAVRTTAMKKHEQLATAVLEYFYEKLRQNMETINDQFLVLIDSIEQKTGSIEDLLEKKLWCRTVPKKIENICLDVYRLRQDCELIALFNRNMDDEDFSTYWRIMELPQKTKNILDRRMIEFENEKEVHKENLKLDQEKLIRGLENLQQEIQLLEDEFDTAKASSVAADIRKIHKTLNTYQENAQLFNKREKLFGQDLTEYPELENISCDLVPYELFWLSSAEFYKYRERDFLDQLAIEPGQLMDSITEFRTNLEDCLDYFTPEINPKLNEAVIRVISEIDEFLHNKMKE